MESNFECYEKQICKLIMIKDGSRAGVFWCDEIVNEQWGKFEFDDWVLNSFKQVIVHKFAVYSCKIGHIEQHYKQLHIKEQVEKWMFIIRREFGFVIG